MSRLESIRACECPSPNLALTEERVAYCTRCGREVRPTGDRYQELALLIAGVIRKGIRLAPESVEEIAIAIVEQMREEPVVSGRPLSAAQVAERLGRKASWVYAHAHELGGKPAGSGSRPRLIFDPAAVDAYAKNGTAGTAKPAPKPATRGRPRSPAEGRSLLPIKGRAA